MYKKTIIILSYWICATISMAQSRPMTMVFMPPDKNNEKIIKRYNRYHYRPNSLYEMTGPFGSNSFTAIFGVNSNSIMSNDDVEVNVLKKWVDNPIYNDKEERYYFIEIKNKTNQTIYIDKGYSFRIYNNSFKMPYYDVSLQSDSCSGKRYITIPPHAKRHLTDYLWEKRNSNYAEITEYPEDFEWSPLAARVHKGFLRYEEARRFTEANSPYHRSFLITYSKDEDFSTYSMLMINFYLRELIGIYYPELYKDDFSDRRLYGADEYTITNCVTLY